MGAVSVWHWIIVVLYLFLFMFPVVKILRRAGFSGWWCMVAVIPPLNLIFLWVFAFARWPNSGAA